MYLNDLLSASFVADKASAEDVVLLPNGVFGWCDKPLLVKRTDWERIYIDSRRREPEVEVVMPALLQGEDRALYTTLGELDSVRKCYANLRNADPAEVGETSAAFSVAPPSAECEADITEIDSTVDPGSIVGAVDTGSGNEAEYTESYGESPGCEDEFTTPDSLEEMLSSVECPAEVGACGPDGLCEEQPVERESLEEDLNGGNESYGEPVSDTVEGAEFGSSEEEEDNSYDPSAGMSAMWSDAFTGSEVPSKTAAVSAEHDECAEFSEDIDHDDLTGDGFDDIPSAVPLHTAASEEAITEVFNNNAAFAAMTSAVAPAEPLNEESSVTQETSGLSMLMGGLFGSQIASATQHIQMSAAFANTGAEEQLAQNGAESDVSGAAEEEEEEEADTAATDAEAGELTSANDDISDTPSEDNTPDAQDVLDMYRELSTPSAASDADCKEEEIQLILEFARTKGMPILVGPAWAQACTDKFREIYDTCCDIVEHIGFERVLEVNSSNAAQLSAELSELCQSEFAPAASDEAFKALLLNSYCCAIEACSKGDTSTAVQIANVWARLFFDEVL